MHAQIVYKATETAVYKIGLASGVDATYPRKSFGEGAEGDHDFTLQWKGATFDTGMLSGYSLWCVGQCPFPPCFHCIHRLKDSAFHCGLLYHVVLRHECLLLQLCPSIRGEEPRDGLMRLKVDIVTLPPLAEAEQTAMLDLRSIETGGQGHFPPFLGYHTGFPDESLFTVNKSARVFMATDLVEPFFHPDEHPCTCVAPPPPPPTSLRTRAISNSNAAC